MFYGSACLCIGLIESYGGVRLYNHMIMLFGVCINVLLYVCIVM